MSTIGVTFHNEDIHNIIYKPATPPIKSPRYKSKRPKVYQPTGRVAKYNGHQTFGVAHYEPPQTSNYLKKGKTKMQPVPPKAATDKEAKAPKTSTIPKPVFESVQKPRKNYVQENIKKIGDIQPKPTCPRRVETPRGTVKDMDHLLQMIKIRESDKYGKLPKYLCERKKRWERERKKREEEELAIQRHKEKMGIGTMGMSEDVYMVDQETRQKILDGLKENWNELSKQFLKLPVIIDTLPKIKKKIWLEREIDQLEKDVKLVESHPYIYLQRHDRQPLAQMISEERNRKELEKQKKEEEVKEKEVQEREEKEEVTEGDQPTEEKAEEDQEVTVLNY